MPVGLGGWLTEWLLPPIPEVTGFRVIKFFLLLNLIFSLCSLVVPCLGKTGKSCLCLFYLQVCSWVKTLDGYKAGPLGPPETSSEQHQTRPCPEDLANAQEEEKTKTPLISG